MKASEGKTTRKDTDMENNIQNAPETANRAKTIAEKGEDAAARFLERRGYEILERNWSCPAGEADIIALDGDTLVFIEVKTSSDIDKGFPEEAVTDEKRTRCERIAAYYLRDSNHGEISFRFDTIGILVLGSNKATLKHHINAFGIE